MTQFIYYHCLKAELPSIEAALAANGYVIENAVQHRIDGQTMLVMRCGETFVLLAQNTCSDLATIEIWGAGQTATVELLRSLPVQLIRQRAPARYEEITPLLDALAQMTDF
jgi:hypothetical protein